MTAITSVSRWFRLVFVLLLAAAACHSSRAARPAPPSAGADFVQLRWLDESGNASQSPYTDPMTGEHIALARDVVLDMSGIDSAWTYSRVLGADTTTEVVVRLSRSAAAALGATTATHVGHRIAVVIDGHVTQVATVTAPLGARAQLAPNLPPAAAAALAARVNRVVAELRPFQPVVFRR